MSSAQAAEEAARLASGFLSQADSKRLVGLIDDVKPDPIEIERDRKVQRYWVATVKWTKDGAELDGPAVIRIDLAESRCQWA